MFNTQSSTNHVKSSIQIKKQSMHDARMIEERDKIKKSIRFSNYSQFLLTTKDKQHIVGQIQNLSPEEAHNKLVQLLRNRQFVPLSCCLFELLNRQNIVRQISILIPLQFMQQLVQNTFEMMYQPQIIAIYKCLTAISPEFHQVMFQYPQTVRNIVKEIYKMKGGPQQDLYLEVLEDVCPSYSKRWQDDTDRLFEDIFAMLQSSTISLNSGINILKYLSPFVNSKTHFSSRIIGYILIEYETYMHSDQNSSDNLQHLQDIFFILIKVIYYTEGLDIITSWRMIQIVLHAGDVLREKVVFGYYNGYLLLAKLIENIQKYEICDLASDQVKSLLNDLIESYKIEKLGPTTIKLTYVITTTLLNHLLRHSLLLEIKQFTPSYLYLIQVITRNCQYEVLINHYTKNDYLSFLVDCVDHDNMEVYGLGIEIFGALLQNIAESFETFATIKDHYKLKEVLQNKLYREGNKTIAKKIMTILERFDQLGPEI